MVQFHAKLVTTHTAHNTLAQKVKTQEFGDGRVARERKMESLSLLRSLLLLAACLLLL